MELQQQILWSRWVSVLLRGLHLIVAVAVLDVLLLSKQLFVDGEEAASVAVAAVKRRNLWVMPVFTA